jgi:hypothetical protein
VTRFLSFCWIVKPFVLDAVHLEYRSETLCRGVSRTQPYTYLQPNDSASLRDLLTTVSRSSSYITSGHDRTCRVRSIK